MSAKERADKLCAFEIRVRKTLQKHRMLTPGENVLVAVSGGADSVALLLCLHTLAPELGLSLAIAHLNHRIRGEEGDADEDFVRRLSAGLRIPYYSEAIEVKQQAAEGKHNLEELARETRYEFLRRTARRIGARKIAVGHNLNDQAETVLFRFIRGSGLEGLSAIHPVVDGIVIRPLIECSREFIVRYLEQKGADYRNDSTNRSLQYTRNRIRMELVPYLEKALNPRVTETLAREAALSRETWSFVEAQAKEALDKLCRSEDGGLSLDLRSFESLHPALQKQVVRQALKRCLGTLRGITSRHVDGILSLCGSGHSGNQIRISRKIVVVRQFDTLLLTQTFPQRKASFARRLEIPGECRIPDAGVVFRSRICRTTALQTIPENHTARACFDPHTLPTFLTIRSKEPGDRYGGPGHRKVKKMLIDGKVPFLQRFSLPMVAAGNDVIWVPGFKPAREFAARPESPDCVVVEMLPDNPLIEF